jgi:hypothetical protein
MHSSQYSTCKKVLIGDLLKTISFLLSHIVQQKAEATTSRCLLKIPPKLLDQVSNK